MSRCVCESAELGGRRLILEVDVVCPLHGLPGDTRFPPMDRHARDVEIVERYTGIDGQPREYRRRRRETAAEVQRRLYAEARA